MLYRRVLRPLVFRLPPERAHHLGALAVRIFGLRGPFAGLLRRLVGRPDPALRTQALAWSWRRRSGWPPASTRTPACFTGALALGFGFVEVGTVTALPQPGNPPPRLARLPADRALLNRFGFNNAGAAAAAARLGRRDRASGVVGANVGKSKAAPLEAAAADYRTSTAAVAPVSDFLVVNVSSPNTVGLRSLQDPAALRPILDAVLAESAGRPVLLKVAPDLSDAELDALADLALELGLAGMIATNTDDRPLRADRSGRGRARLRAGGGISGAPLKPRALAVLRRLHARTDGRLLLVAAGGIETAQDAWERVLAGAALLEVYTAFVYEGPLFAARIGQELADLARAQGYARVQDAVGVGTP